MILHLTLKHEYFSLIMHGVKKIEFREKKPYWDRRLFKQRWTEVHFRNGYRKDSPFMRVEYLGIESFNGYYCIRLGDVLEVKNYHLRKPQ